MTRHVIPVEGWVWGGQSVPGGIWTPVDAQSNGCKEEEGLQGETHRMFIPETQR